MAYKPEQHLVANHDGQWQNKILSLREQAKVINRWLKLRLETVLPAVMLREHFDLWIMLSYLYSTHE